MNRGINPFPEGASYKEYTLPAVSIRSLRERTVSI